MQMRSARFAGYLQLLLAFGALFEVIRRFLVGSDPEPPSMIGIALLALVANVACMALIAKHRQGGAHMRASWICPEEPGVQVAQHEMPLHRCLVGAGVSGRVFVDLSPRKLIPRRWGRSLLPTHAAGSRTKR